MLLGPWSFSCLASCCLALGQHGFNLLSALVSALGCFGLHVQHVGCLVCCFHVDDSCSAWLLFAYFHALCDWVDQFCESEFVFQLAFGFRCLVFGAKLLCWLLVCAFLGCSLLLLGPWTLNFCVGLWLAMVAMVSALAWPLVALGAIMCCWSAMVGLWFHVDAWPLF
ncbi:uncharacterized protein A4U43_C02F13040 [Asparagus officinalis]|uniref:Uncharacterized protein n=1 Tax=Asparagus officinalis TaxID=4686 RepID=A0A5P1FI31_ASPOF|nr:uncharacterized protein A4U43_C02F13040 [Asparagus officinalis]